MNQEMKQLLSYFGLIFLAVILTYQLPHDTYSISQYMIPPIRIGKGSYLYLSGVLPLAIILIGVKGIVYSERFRGRNRFLMVILIIFFIMPLMKYSIDFLRSGYYWIRNDKLDTVDIMDSNISIRGTNDKVNINFKIEVKDFGKNHNEFQIRVYLPTEIRKMVGYDYYETVNTYRTTRHNNRIKVNETWTIDRNDIQKKIEDPLWIYEDVKYELFNEDEVIDILVHGS